MRPVGSKYFLEEPLGRGATGTVWRGRVGVPPGAEPVGAPWGSEAAGSEAAVQGAPGETVAVKVLKEELAGDSDVVMRFLRERSVLLRLTHPNIVRVRDLVVEGDLLALVMDLVDGPDLHRYLREHGPLAPAAAAALTAQVADALAASHADGVVHRDLKPANVLIKQDGDTLFPLLTDFGIARLADSPGLTRTSEFVGTPAYVAPESAEGRPQTAAVDVYGAGILLYETLTGRPPFAGQSTLDVLRQHLSAEPRRPSTVPDPLWTVIERCLSKEPERRPSAENLARALRTVADGIGVHASAAQIAAAEGVAALLAPHPDPPVVPGTEGAHDPTLAHGVPYDPEGATSVLPQTGAGAGSGAAAAGTPSGPDAEATSVLPSTGGPDPTSVMPPVPQEPPAPEGPHPWESQLRAARDRNEQTQMQYLDPGQDPLRHRPRRQAAHPPQQPQQGRPYAPPQQHRPQPRRPQPRPQQYAPPQPQQYAPPQPQQYAPPQQRPPREPRRSNPNRTRIPGLGCLKGCLVTLVILFVASWLVWELSPLQEWVDSTRSFWGEVTHLFDTVSDWVGKLGDLGGDSGDGTGTGTGTGTGNG